MPRLHLSDNARANWSTLPTLLLVAAVIGADALLSDTPSPFYELWITTYLIAWPVYVGTYLLWTHLSLTRQDPEELAARLRKEDARPRRRLSWLYDFGGATNWTLSAAIVAVAITLIIAQSPAHRGDWLAIGLGILAVGSSWALMVCSFAQQYFRLALREDDDRHIELRLGEGKRFEDYLTLAVLLSTMAATVSATIRSREAWKVVRANVLLAFVFNTVIVAMVVSLLFGGLID